MATFTTKSTEMTNLLAAPPVLTNGYIAQGNFKEHVATLEVAAADVDGSVYAFCALPSNARVSSLEYANDAIAGGTSYDIGLYTVDRDGTITAVDVDNFASAVVMTSAATGWVDATFEQDITDIDKVEKRLFERDGIALAADPKVTYILAMTANTVGTAAGTISVRVRYVS